MFRDSSIFVLAGGAHFNEIFRIEVDAETQAAICQSFSEAKENMIADKERIVFDGSYKPNEEEYLAIENFQIDEKIKMAIRDPLGAPAYQMQEGAFPEIKAVFVGIHTEAGGSETFNIALQRFRKEQYISTKGFNLFFNENTFFRQNSFGISISDSIDCYYTNGELQFTSFYFARQIFDLGDYYRSATDREVASFVSNSKLEIEDTEAFGRMADSWIRRKIAMINDSKVLDNYTASEIAKCAKAIGVRINLHGKRIQLPNDKKQIKIILGFLDEEAYKGPFSQSTYLANSKRRIGSR